jgi:hypothetical protein
MQRCDPRKRLHGEAKLWLRRWSAEAGIVKEAGADTGLLYKGPEPLVMLHRNCVLIPTSMVSLKYDSIASMNTCTGFSSLLLSPERLESLDRGAFGAGSRGRGPGLSRGIERSSSHPPIEDCSWELLAIRICGRSLSSIRSPQADSSNAEVRHLLENPHHNTLL